MNLCIWITYYKYWNMKRCVYIEAGNFTEAQTFFFLHFSSIIVDFCLFVLFVCLFFKGVTNCL